MSGDEVGRPTTCPCQDAGEVGDGEVGRPVSGVGRGCWRRRAHPGVDEDAGGSAAGGEEGVARVDACVGIAVLVILLITLFGHLF